MITEVRRLDDNGIEKFQRIMNDPTDEELEEILQNDSTDTNERIQINPQRLKERFRSKFDFGEYLVDIIPYTSENERAIYSDLRGIGTWLSLAFIDTITVGQRQAREFYLARNRYIPSLDTTGTIYRHHVLGTWKLYGMHGRQSIVFLTGYPSSFSNLVATLSIFPDVMESTPVCRALSRYFLNPQTNELRQGWSEKLKGATKLMNMARRTQNLRLMDDDKLYRLFVDKLGEMI